MWVSESVEWNSFEKEECFVNENLQVAWGMEC